MQSLCAVLLAFSACVFQADAAAVIRTTSTVTSWQRQDAAPEDHALKLHIAVRQADNGAAVEQKLMALADPQSRNFRQHLDPRGAAELSIPAEESTLAIEQWLEQHNLLKNASLSAGIYEVNTDVLSAQRLLNTTYHLYTHEARSIVRTEHYYLPDTVANHVDFVTPTTFFPAASASRNLPVNGSLPAKDQIFLKPTRSNLWCGSSDQTEPACIRQIYNVNYNATPNRTTFAVYGTEAATFKAGDLHTFLKLYNAPAAKANAQFQVIGNGAANESSGIASAFETALDTQTLLGLAWPAKGLLYRNGGVFGPKLGQTYDPFVQFLHELITNETVPSVVSFSESNPEDAFDPSYARRLCNMMAQVGMRGTTLLFSTGDNGPSADVNKTVTFQPRFPASCPWVTAVGGTTDLASETAATRSTIPFFDRISYTSSGGGFSNFFSAPHYQAGITSKYIAEQIPATYHSVPGFNPSGRGYPDVSAFSTDFPVVVDHITVPIGGTSASTPTWAAIVTLLNDYEASKGRPTLGFVNPWLYSLTSGLKDITTGGNNKGSCGLGCGFATLLGYNTTEGWDAVTGLGSPLFDQLTLALDTLAQ